MPENFDYPSYKIQSYQDFSVTNLHLHIIIRDNACKKLPDNDVETYNQIGQQDKDWEGSDDQFNEGRMRKQHSVILYFLTLR